jgi:hypothetical protein
VPAFGDQRGEPLLRLRDVIGGGDAADVEALRARSRAQVRDELRAVAQKSRFA